MKLRFTLAITELHLGLCVLSCRCLVVGNLEFFGGDAINHRPCLVDDNFDLGSAPSPVKLYEKGSCRVATSRPCRNLQLEQWHGSRIVDLPNSAYLLESSC